MVCGVSFEEENLKWTKVRGHDLRKHFYVVFQVCQNEGCCAYSDADEEMGAVKMRCQELLHDPKCQQKLADVWGSGAGLVLDETRAAMGRLLKVRLPHVVLSFLKHLTSLQGPNVTLEL